MASILAPVTEDSRPAFSIERILGLDLERPGSCLKLHRPWAGEEQMFPISTPFCSSDELKSDRQFLIDESLTVWTVCILLYIYNKMYRNDQLFPRCLVFIYNI